MNPNRPGGPLYEKPISLSEKDREFSKAFWDAGQPEGLKNVMSENIMTAAGQEGTFSLFVGTVEGGVLDEKSKRKMSAYRALAFEHGVLMSAFELNEKSGTATARMFRIHELVN